MPFSLNNIQTKATSKLVYVNSNTVFAPFFFFLEFGLKRILLRSAIGILVIGLAELFPNFGPILSLIGASTVTMLSFILPAIFYLKLEEKHLIPLHQYVFHIEIILIAFVVGCCGTYSAILGLSNPFKN